MATSELIGQTKRQLYRIEEKDFFQIPAIKRFLDNVVETEGRFTFNFNYFENAKK